jgi:hypothetical protein
MNKGVNIVKDRLNRPPSLARDEGPTSKRVGFKFMLLNLQSTYRTNFVPISPSPVLLFKIAAIGPCF